MDDYLVVISFMATFSLVFFILQVSENQFPRNVVYGMVSVAANFVTSTIAYALNSLLSLPFSMFFFFMGMASLAFVVIAGIAQLKLKQRRNSIFGNIWKQG